MNPLPTPLLPGQRRPLQGGRAAAKVAPNKIRTR